MVSTPAEGKEIIGGVDTHQDLYTAAVVTLEGKVLGTESFSTTRAGHQAMLAWFRAHGELLRVGVESTGSYGAGITRLLALSGVPVLEVTGPDPAARRARGKDGRDLPQRHGGRMNGGSPHVPGRALAEQRRGAEARDLPILRASLGSQPSPGPMLEPVLPLPGEDRRVEDPPQDNSQRMLPRALTTSRNPP